MKRIAALLSALFVFNTVFLPPVWSRDNTVLPPVAVKAKAIVEAAHAYIQTHANDMKAVQKALQNDSRFKDDTQGLYIFVHTYNAAKEEAICIGHGVRPELLGKNMWHLRTPNGRRLFDELVHLAETDGEGWLEYDWLNPYTIRIQTKISYVKKIVLKDDRKAWVGCGFWK